jgi:hypothetical protein
VTTDSHSKAHAIVSIQWSCILEEIDRLSGGSFDLLVGIKALEQEPLISQSNHNRCIVAA